MRIIKETESTIICVKPAGVLSTDEPGGMPSLVRDALGENSSGISTVHRLDRVVSGLMVLAKNRTAASLLGEQIMTRSFEKEYLAVVHGCPPETEGRFKDLLFRDRYARRTLIADTPAKGVQDAVLDYFLLDKADDLSLVKILLGTGRTHQIRVQFSSRDMPIVGDRKYGTPEDGCDIALWSYRLAFNEPVTGERIDVSLSDRAVSVGSVRILKNACKKGSPPTGASFKLLFFSEDQTAKGSGLSMICPGQSSSGSQRSYFFT